MDQEEKTTADKQEKPLKNWDEALKELKHFIIKEKQQQKEKDKK